ncbi:formate dehydrogenase subunit alpha [Natronolimnohabitans innermongolicus]|uniref:Formate dehydrogenase subunit alpha n=1 Tax=Natronolimnohabitans innermongolicus JCM 12255 TaxID=1227499 RepID=L9WGS2_9EURY|nr:formate dehydrogenase subunit alpha [Natronolimnohabitans innermongolicus]ELY48532.1 formate dehydrogenase subunit alpha [Natronolimnohabitans innermongolicus JCM 12255]
MSSEDPASHVDDVEAERRPTAVAQLPSVPNVTDPRPSTPLTEQFETGTANDPDVRSAGVGTATGTATSAGTDADAVEEMIRLTVDGTPVSVPPGSTIIDALEAVEPAAEVAALCYYDRDTEQADAIGPRGACRTCTVHTEEHGLVSSCSHPAEDGMTVRTDEDGATEAREVNLDLQLSDHNLRCTTCGQNGRCELQDTSIEQGVEEPRWGVFEDRDEYEPLDDTSPAIQIDRNKCILCNRCVEACNDVQVEGVLRMEGNGQDTRIAFQNGEETFDESTCVSCGHCATVCPTGALVEQGLTDAATIPLPGFTQANSIGTVLESPKAETADQTEAPNRDLPYDIDGRGGATDADEDLAGVARFMSIAKARAGDARTRARHTLLEAGDRALAEFEHVAEEIASEAMPAGRLFNVATTIGDARLSRITKAETTCNYCAVGCRFELYGKDGEVLGVRPAEAEAAPANDFSTCVKGKFGYDFVDADDRLETPLIRKEDAPDGPVGREAFREATWAEAIDRVYEGLSEIRDEHGADALSVISSSKTTNEENYLNQKFARQVLGTPHVDNCARLCHSSTVAGLQQTVGYGAMTNRINEDIGETDCYLITGSNTTESHPVLATRIKQNVRDGAELIVFDPREIGLAEHADRYVRTTPGEDVAWLNGMMRHIIEEDLYDEAFVEERTRNFDDLKEKVEPFTPEQVEELTAVPAAELKAAAETIATADTCIFGWAMGLTQHTTGTRNVMAIADLALLTGNLGKPRAGLSPFRGQNNVQGGGGDMGPAPHTLPGYQSLGDEAVLEKFEGEWGVRPPNDIGLRLPEQFHAIDDGELRGMFVMGENPVLSEPDIDDVERSLREIDFLAVQDIFLSETAEYADVVLPAASAAEKSGTFTNTERRIQRVRPAVDPPGVAEPDQEILIRLARRFGYDWDYDGPADVMDEISSLVPIYGGVTYERLEAEPNGIQWPCVDEDDPGTPYLYEDEFNFEDGKARFVPADYASPPDMPDEEYPLTLSSGRVLYHWHTGTMTRRVGTSMNHVPESFVTIHPEMAAELGIEDEEYVRVQSRQGEIVVKSNVEDTADPGVVFIPMHFPQGAINKLTQHELDPTSYIPQYKVTSVRVTPLDVPPSEAANLVDPTPGQLEGQQGDPDDVGGRRADD